MFEASMFRRFATGAISQLGFARTTMDAIAKQAGGIELTLYSHFENKDLLFKAMITVKCREFTSPRTSPRSRTSSRAGH
jgi:AcrR family transcriptional regulator